MDSKKEVRREDHIPYKGVSYSQDEMFERATNFYHEMNLRRTVRVFDSRSVSQEIIEKIILTASTAPSGAHKQPWTFCAISNSTIKHDIRTAAEKEEYESYHGRMSEEWLNDLAPIGTNWEKPFLEDAPWLIAVFKKIYDQNGDEKTNNYYVNESVGIACGITHYRHSPCGLGNSHSHTFSDELSYKNFEPTK